MSSAQQVFWHWFLEHEEELFDFEADQEPRFDQLSWQLARVHPDLCFEFGPPGERREFVISASGIRDAFPAVSSLAAAAPEMKRWHIVGFRPRRSPLSSIQVGDTCIDPADVEFSMLTNGAEIGIQLFMPGFKEEDTILKQIGYLMLDEALGEYDVETGVGLIKILPPESPQRFHRFPISELPARFDQLISKLAGGSKLSQPS